MGRMCSQVMQDKEIRRWIGTIKAIASSSPACQPGSSTPSVGGYPRFLEMFGGDSAEPWSPYLACTSLVAFGKGSLLPNHSKLLRFPVSTVRQCTNTTGL